MNLSKFVETENVFRFQAALTALERRGAEECRFIIVDGDPGLGKTKIIQRFAFDNKWIFLTADIDWDTNSLVSKILKDGLNMQVPHLRQARTDAIVEALKKRRQDYEKLKKQFCVVIDEADAISLNRSVIEKIRYFADMAHVPFVLIGMGTIRTNLVRFKQVTSRVTRYVEFFGLERHDVRAILDEICDFKIADDLLEYITIRTEGKTREIKECMKHIELFSQLNAPDENNGVDMAHMAGQILFYDRHTQQPVDVPKGEF